MTSKDLKDLLQTVAAEGRETVDLGEQQLVPRIRSRRRRQRIVVAAASLGTAAVIAAAAVAIVPNLGTDEPAVAGSGLSANGVAIGGCGEAVSGEPRSDAVLKLAAADSVKPVAGSSDLATIELRVTNATGSPLSLTTARGAGITVAQQGLVVGTAAPIRDSAVQLVTLLPGQTQSYLSTVSLRRCGDASTQAGQPLTPGSYQLYATQRFSPTDGGQVIEAQGGPWTVELK